MSKTKAKPIRSRRLSSVRYVLVGMDEAMKDYFGRSHTFWCGDDAAIHSAIEQASSDWTWICGDSENAENLLGQVAVFQAQHHGSRSRFGDLLMLESPRPQMLSSLHGCFDNVIGEAVSFTTLPIDQLADVLNSDNKANLFIGGVVDEKTKTVALVRGNFNRLTVPLTFFRSSGTTRPDFRKFSVDDYGQTIKFGNYEASADAILYELDSEYRRKINTQRRANEKSFGASLRRLRLQRGLAREAFSGVSSKTIARIERSEVDRPQGRTLSVIAKTLKVAPDEIESY